MMRILAVISIATVALLVSCKDARKPSRAHFTAAVNQYLTRHGQTCTLIRRQFPVDLPRSELNNPSGIVTKLTALERAELVSGIDTTAVVHGMLDPLRGPSPPQPVRRFQLTAEGQKYFQQIPSSLGPTGAFCYGQKSVGSIVNWTESGTGALSQAEVTYTYQIVNLADWTERSDLQQVFPDVKAMLNGASRTNQTISVELMNKGWEVPGP
jgi:hypothetical protein